MTIGQVVGRIGALALAILLIAGALVWRGRADDGAGVSDGATEVPTTAADPGTVRCAAELGVCEELAQVLGDEVEVVAEDGVVTARSLQDATTTEVWVTLDALVDMVADARERGSRQPLFAPDPPMVAASPLVLVGWQDRLAVLEETCGVTWSCVGQVAGTPWAQAGGQAAWGDPKPAHDAPDRSGVGLLVAAQAVASRLDGAAVTPRNLDSPEVQDWFATLERAVPSFQPSSGSQLVEMVQFGPSSRDVVGTTEAEAAEVLTRAGTRAAGLSVGPSSPPVTARVVVAVPTGGRTPEGLDDALREALQAAGWRVDGDQPTVTLPSPVPSPEGEPPQLTGGALEAVLLRWEQVVR